MSSPTPHATIWAPQGPLTIEQAAASWRELTPLFDAGPDLDVDLSGVSRIDTAGCQLLIAARLETTRRGGAWRAHGAAAAVLETMTLLGTETAIEGFDTREGRS